MTEKVWVKALVDPKLYTKVPGIGITLWGHTFETQIDGSLCMEMDIAFVKSEVRSGRIRVLEKPPPGKSNEEMASRIIVEDKEPSFTFTSEIKDYYGAGDFNLLMEEVKSMTKSQLMDFIDERFPDHEIRKTMNKEVIIDKTRSLIDVARIKYVEEQELEDSE